jgi:threonine dehydratase
MITLADIDAAARVLKGHILRTPCFPAPRLSALVGTEVWVKYENQQVTASFKERGALNKLSSLTPDERKRGVVAMSAGNHAQAVAYHARRLGIPSTIVMPEGTPFVKVAATEAHGATVVLHGATLDVSQTKAQELANSHGLTWVHPYDDPLTAAGQGTIAREMLEDAPDLDTIIVPVGGGGLMSGIAVGAKALKPSIRMIAVEAQLYPSLYAALRGIESVCGGATLAEGIAVKHVGKLALSILPPLLEDTVLVSETDIERAVNAYLTLQKTMAEGAGAAGLAALLADPHRYRGRKVGLVLCGGNIDPRMAASVMVRELEREERIVGFRIRIDDKPGTLAAITTILGRLGANILEVEHKRMFLDVPAKGASVDVMVETRDGAHAERVAQALSEEGFQPRRIPAGGA